MKSGQAHDPGDAPRKTYDPAATFDLDVSDVPLRVNTGGRQLLARVYRPRPKRTQAPLFPLVLDLHGGAWAVKDRIAEEQMDRAIASSGVVVVAIDLTRSPESPHPANIQDAHYGVRWVKSRASRWNADGSSIGIYGSSTGGHIAILLAMRPQDARYGAIPLDEAPDLDASVAYVAARSPITDPLARWQQAVKMDRQDLVRATRLYFHPWESIYAANPQQILERQEPVSLPPLLILQGGLDQNVPPALQERFVHTYRGAGGDCQYELFENCDHEWTNTPGLQFRRACERVKSFIAQRIEAEVGSLVGDS